jgi:hypothetical protein
MHDPNLPIAAAMAVFVALAAGIAYRSRHGDRYRATAWMITIAAFIAVLEDAGLLILFASVDPGVDPDGALGIVRPHVRGHMYGAGVFAAAGLVLSVWVAHTALRRAERWAWRALLVYLLLTAAVDVTEVLFIYPHGLPLGVTPPVGGRGFGWPQIAAWIVIWAFALWYGRPTRQPARAPATSEESSVYPAPAYVHQVGRASEGSRGCSGVGMNRMPGP